MKLLMTPNFKYLQQRINLFLASTLAKYDSSTLKQAMQYSLLAEGKRIRPILVYLTGQLFGCALDKLDAPAAAIEAIHSYSLIHDDLPSMDDDDLRRGLPTCHIQFGEAQAILAGDALQALAFSLLSETTCLPDNIKIKMIQELAQSSGLSGMCLGQSLDLEAEHQSITLDRLTKIHNNKTGALMRSAIRLGALACGEVAKPYYSELDNYANAIGLAFQIQDDILDVIGDQSIMGKPQGSDMHLEKSTYPALMGLDEASILTEKLYQKAIDSLIKIPYDSQQLCDIANFIIQRHR